MKGFIDSLFVYLSFISIIAITFDCLLVSHLMKGLFPGEVESD